MKRIITILLGLLMTTLSFAQQPKSPTIAIQNFAQPSPTSIEYDVVVGTDCVKYIYMHADTSIVTLYQSMGMTLEQFLEAMVSYGIEWITVTEGQIDHYSFSDFEPNTTYGAYIYAQSASGESTVVTHTFTTTQGGGEGEAQLSMNVSYPQANQAHIDVTINDQTAYYWYTTLDDQLLSNFNLSISQASTQDYYNVMDQLVNAQGMSYFVHTSNISEDFTDGVNVEAGCQYVAVAFPFNSNDELGTYTEPIVFSVTGSGSNSILSAQQVSLKVWPNPAVEKISLEADSPITHVAMYDLRGSKMMEKSSLSSNVTLNLDGISSGHYLIKVQTIKGTAAKLVVVE